MKIKDRVQPPGLQKFSEVPRGEVFRYPSDASGKLYLKLPTDGMATGSGQAFSLEGKQISLFMFTAPVLRVDTVLEVRDYTEPAGDQ